MMKEFIAGVITSFTLLYSFGFVQLPYQERQQIFKEFVMQGKIGSSIDFWLVQGNSLYRGEDHVALFFGYGDDRQECERSVSHLKKEFPLADYFCTKANLK